jgi:hypothetical protein
MAKTKSDEERQALVGLARLGGWSDERILRVLITGVRGADKRKELIVEGEKYMGFEASEDLGKAHKAGLILTTDPPKSLLKKKTPLLDKTPEKLS